MNEVKIFECKIPYYNNTRVACSRVRVSDESIIKVDRERTEEKRRK
jgi:hypothetical protein